MSTVPWAGGRFGTASACVLAPNPSIMTLDGTNTWILRPAPESPAFVVDPGPLDAQHLEDVAQAAGPVRGVLLTHGHLDHSEGARALAERVAAPVRALDPAHRLGGEGLVEGDVLDLDGWEIRVIGTPGHTADSLSFLLPAEGAVLTGDTVLGRGTTVVAHPDGRLGAYLDSLDRLQALAAAHELSAIWPGHGPVISDALGVLDYYIAHRRERLDSVREAVRVLASDPTSYAVHVAEDRLARAVVELVYTDVDPVLWGAAELSVRAQLDYLLSTPG